jgi:uncharacterized protein (TIGR03086 family)
MASWLELCKIALDGFGRRVHAVEDWHAPTPDTEWDVTDLVRHVVVEQQWVRPLAGGLSLDDAAKQVSEVGDDLVAEWDRYAAEALDAWNAAPADQIVSLSRGQTPIEDYLREMVWDATIHSWDLARAIGADEELDPRLVEAVWNDLQSVREMLASSGMFAAPVEVGEDASLQDRLLALTGRDPR